MYGSVSSKNRWPYEPTNPNIITGISNDRYLVGLKKKPVIKATRITTTGQIATTAKARIYVAISPPDVSVMSTQAMRALPTATKPCDK